MDTFQCTYKGEYWFGSITMLNCYGSHYEFMIQSRSSIMVIFGRTSRGYFSCMPDFGAGCHLVDLQNIFWNTEKLTSVLGKVDGITVAGALYFLNEKGLITPLSIQYH